MNIIGSTTVFLDDSNSRNLFSVINSSKKGTAGCFLVDICHYLLTNLFYPLIFMRNQYGGRGMIKATLAIQYKLWY